MATQTVLTCGQFSQSAEGVTSCTSQVWAEAFVVTPEQQAQLELVINGGFDSESFMQFFAGTLLMFAIGFGCGIVISQIRKVGRGI